MPRSMRACAASGWRSCRVTGSLARRWSWPPRARRGSVRLRRIAAIAALSGIIAGVAFWALLPARLFDAPLSYVLEARDGSLLGARIAADGQWRFPARPVVPDKFRRALLVFEDKRFESHSGIDGLAIARALRLNIQQGQIVSGASTLTMQVARLARASRAPGGQRSWNAKLAEAL